MERPFASGSRKAPDPFDQFLEDANFYRKHTARDSSCLFRVISEQLYDTQNYHLQIRKRCVEYMRQHKYYYQLKVDCDVDEYLNDMSKPRTYGTMLELQAVCHLYRRNLILFEAFDTGTRIIQNDKYDKVFQVFFSHEKHFDSVFEINHIKIAAFCQSITYKILYESVFKLPDVSYATEQMLYGFCDDNAIREIRYNGSYASEVNMYDGRVFYLNRPENTNCILENDRLCHFHNPNFTNFYDELHHMCIRDDSEGGNVSVSRQMTSLLPEKYISCVRQLLNEEITPFPYKVAKSLDSDIYRNVEFDVWSDIRKQERLNNWYMGGNDFKIGVKCLADLNGNRLKCHIQEICYNKQTCIVFVENYGRRITVVPYNSLYPLPNGEDQAWPLPVRMQKRCEQKQSNRRLKMTTGSNSKRYDDTYRIYNSQGRCKLISDYNNKIKSDCKIMFTEEMNEEFQYEAYTTLEHFQPLPCEYITIPLTQKSFKKDLDSFESNQTPPHPPPVSSASSTVIETGIGLNESDQIQPNEEEDANIPLLESDQLINSYSPTGVEPVYNSYANEMPAALPNYPPHEFYTNNYPMYCMVNNSFPPLNGTSNGSFVPNTYFTPPSPVSYHTTGTPYFQQQCYQVPIPTVPLTPSATPANPNLSTIDIRRDISFQNPNIMPPRVNYNARIPLYTYEQFTTDIPQLHFFYNLGVECYRRMQLGEVLLNPLQYNTSQDRVFVRDSDSTVQSTEVDTSNCLSVTVTDTDTDSGHATNICNNNNVHITNSNNGSNNNNKYSNNRINNNNNFNNTNTTNTKTNTNNNKTTMNSSSSNNRTHNDHLYSKPMPNSGNSKNYNRHDQYNNWVRMPPRYSNQRKENSAFKRHNADENWRSFSQTNKPLPKSKSNNICPGVDADQSENVNPSNSSSSTSTQRGATQISPLTVSASPEKQSQPLSLSTTTNATTTISDPNCESTSSMPVNYSVAGNLSGNLNVVNSMYQPIENDQSQIYMRGTFPMPYGYIAAHQLPTAPCMPLIAPTTPQPLQVPINYNQPIVSSPANNPSEIIDFHPNSYQGYSSYLYTPNNSGYVPQIAPPQSFWVPTAASPATPMHPAAHMLSASPHTYSNSTSIQASSTQNPTTAGIDGGEPPASNEYNANNSANLSR